MPASIGVNLRVTGNCRQGGRKYMEDFFSVAYQQTEDEKDLEYAFFGIFDGHGGAEAAAFAKEHLMETIIKHKNFWSDNDEDVLRAIKDGYIATHYAMWREQSKWPKTSSGLPSTAGTTASVAFIRRGKIYIGHVGDSGIILGYQESGSSEWKAKPLTKDHKPENPEEMKRIESCGGKVVPKSGVPRVVWNRPRIGHQGPVRRSTPIDEIPFLAVARSLGDLWSYNSQINQFIVSPDPDCSVLSIDANVHRCLIFGTDGLFNMLSPIMAVHIVQQAERHNECAALSDSVNKMWLNPSKLLVQHALERWMTTKMRADNTSVVTLMLDPPGPPRAQVLKDRKKNLPESGLKIMTRYDESSPQTPTHTTCNSKQKIENEESASNEKTILPLDDGDSKAKIEEDKNISEYKSVEKCDKTLLPEPNSNFSISSSDISSNFPPSENNDKHFIPKLRESTSFDPRETLKEDVEPLVDNNKVIQAPEDNSIQINEISSSNIEDNILEQDKITIECEEQKPLVRTKKGFKSNDVEKKKFLKRKTEAEENIQRKSLRLSLNQKTESKKPAPCTLAEEKLKKLAEEAEKVKLLKESHDESTKGYNNGKKRNGKKLSITQRFLKSKKINFKKKTSKDPLNKTKIKMGLQSTLLKSTKKTVLKLNTEIKKSKSKSVENIKNAANIIKKASKKDKKKQQKQFSSNIRIKRSDKVIAGKLSSFKRQSFKSSSMKSKDVNTRTGRALKSVIENSNKKVRTEKSDKKIQKISDNGNSKSNITVKPVLNENKSKKNSRTNKDLNKDVSNKRETRSSVSSCQSSVRGLDGNKELNAKENITPKGAKVTPTQKKHIQSKSAKKDTLRQRIQNKTKVLKKTVLRK